MACLGRCLLRDTNQMPAHPRASSNLIAAGGHDLYRRAAAAGPRVRTRGLPDGAWVDLGSVHLWVCGGLVWVWVSGCVDVWVGWRALQA